MNSIPAQRERAATVEFGYTPWGMDVVRLAEPVTVTVANKLLPRARSIARNGGVLLTIEGRLVRSTVHRGSEASVSHLEFAWMTSELADALRQPLCADRVSDDQLHAVLVRAGLCPAPTIANVDCSCAVRTPMCVHVLATIYALAQQIDNAPQLALDIQSVDLASSDTPGDIVVTTWVPLREIAVDTFYDLPPV